ncbi:MAG: PAS domain S-box protein [Dehalococcoidia bacterium]|nr:PAS domain S-box protein [Dehalococcoidia bacterium]
MLSLLVAIHYHAFVFADVRLLSQVSSILSSTPIGDSLERALFLIPIICGAVMFGVGGGTSVLALASAAMLPRVFLDSAAPWQALFETGGIILIGALAVSLCDALRRGRQRLAELEKTQSTLNSQVKRLSMLHIIWGILSQSLELGQVLNAARNGVTQIMGVDAMWLHLWDREKGALKLAASSGLSEAVVRRLCEGLDGTVAQSKRPIAIESVSATPVFKRLLEQSGLQSVLSVPLVAKGDILGTLGIGSRLVYHYTADEVNLVSAIGLQISMAIDNARLYERERLVAEALRVSERNYRELFENASDAIWVHDLNGTVTAVNSAFEQLSGYGRNALIGANVTTLLPSHCQSRADKEAHDKVLKGDPSEPYEQELVKKDGSVVTVQLGTSLISKDGQPCAFQHIARDVTEAKIIQDNLRFYVRQVSQAQEAERKRIARELHDGPVQALVAVSLNLDGLVSGSPPVSARDIQEQVRGILQEVRRFGQQLRPSILDDLGLLPALKWLASDLTRSYGVDTNVEVIGKPRQLPSETELMLFRIVQEALTNVRKHSGANSACVRVEFTNHNTRIVVNDNGKGFELPARVGDLARIGKLGLAGMHERVQLLGGTLNIHSEAGKGTSVTVEIPQ